MRDAPVLPSHVSAMEAKYGTPPIPDAPLNAMHRHVMRHTNMGCTIPTWDAPYGHVRRHTNMRFSW